MHQELCKILTRLFVLNPKHTNGSRFTYREPVLTSASFSFLVGVLTDRGVTLFLTHHGLLLVPEFPHWRYHGARIWTTSKLQIRSQYYISMLMNHIIGAQRLSNVPGN